MDENTAGQGPVERMVRPDALPVPRLTDAPEAVWLVYGDLERDATHRECCASGEVTWCEDAQFPADVRYLRADLLYQQAREIAAQEVAAERERWVAKAGTAYTEAHAIFNDPPSETAQEVRDVIEWHLYRMRHDEIEGPNVGANRETPHDDA